MISERLSEVSQEPVSELAIKYVGRNLNIMAREIHKLNRNWWINIHTGEPLDRNVGETLFLVASELVEAMEGHRKDKMDDKLPHRKMFEVEVMDAMIRLLDLAYGFGLDFEAMVEKIQYNRHRSDHKIENRLQEGGKAY